MARIINHPLGELSGKVGAVVFKKTKYGSYLSSVPSGPPPKASALQELQQSKMKAVMHFLTPLRVILKHTFFHVKKIQQSIFDMQLILNIFDHTKHQVMKKMGLHLTLHFLE